MKMMKMTKVKTIDYNHYKNNLKFVIIIIIDFLIASVQKINNLTTFLLSLHRRSHQNIIRTSSLIFSLPFGRVLRSTTRQCEMWILLLQSTVSNKTKTPTLFTYDWPLEQVIHPKQCSFLPQSLLVHHCLVLPQHVTQGNWQGLCRCALSRLDQRRARHQGVLQLSQLGILFRC